jgi:ADP-ribose pyrophosphatase YjhB (NUDIX family)
VIIASQRAVLVGRGKEEATLTVPVGNIEPAQSVEDTAACETLEEDNARVVAVSSVPSA